MKIETIAIHGGYQPEPTAKAVTVPIYQTTSYVFDNIQHGADLFDLKVEGNIYTWFMNSTMAVLKQGVSIIEAGLSSVMVITDYILRLHK